MAVVEQLTLASGVAVRASTGAGTQPGLGVTEGALAPFHPAVATWFAHRFPEGPTEAQFEAWPRIAARQHTLVAAPTGSGKTLAAFLVCIDRLYRAAERGEDISGRTQVVYVSPLRALAVDIGQNLEAPLAEIAAVAAELGHTPPPIEVAVRNGDTTSSERARQVRTPPNLLVTTPESLYLLLTAQRSRRILESVETVIVDEIHAVARDKRGSHLALTLERLEHLCVTSPVRVGLSATQRPIETVADLLVGRALPGSARNADCAIVDVGHQRHLDVALELPEGELEAVISAEQMGEVLDRIASLVTEHRTTLVFVNTRRLAERLAHQLADRLGDDGVAAHHGSLSKDRRLRVEHRLRAGELRALVATASLELGIDIGPVDLVCQIGSPRSIATFLQRVGRSGHSRHGTPKGRLFPLTRDELVECTALLIAVRNGRLDAICPPEEPIDILAQQIVAEAATGEWTEDELYKLMRGAAPFAELTRERFDQALTLVSEGIVTGRGRRGAYVHRDRVNHEVRARRGARLAALTSGGAIPEVADYRVVAEPDDTFIGTVNEDWAIESMAGDIFLLGSTSWQIRRVEPGVVRVVDANGAPPSVPFWLGEAPARTHELSLEVSTLRAEVERFLEAGCPDHARGWLVTEAGVDGAAAETIVTYLAASRAALGALPTHDHLVIERFFDDSDGMQLVVHAPFGGRINRGLGLSLRKRFCLSFDFELQAAASDDAVVLSLGPQHSFPLQDVARFLHSNTVEEVLRQAVLASPMFTARWRWNLNRALAVLRWKGGRRNPPPIQRMEADDIMAAVFPRLAACQENQTGPIEIPDHPIVEQTMHDCLHEAMDIDGLRRLVERLESGDLQVSVRDNSEPSPLAHEILSARPYTFLDDAPLEERRTRAVPLRRGLPVDLSEIGGVDQAAIDRVRAEVGPEPTSPDELHDVLASLGVATAVDEWRPLFEQLRAVRRAGSAVVDGVERWCAAETRTLAEAVFPDARFEPAARVEPAVPIDADGAAVHLVRGLLEVSGPTTAHDLSQRSGLRQSTVAIALAALEAEGTIIQGRFTESSNAAPVDDDSTVEWCARRLLARVHRYTQKRLRREVEPVTAQDLMRFLLAWQGVTSDRKRAATSRSVVEVIDQLQGFELAAGAWERAVLPARVTGYRKSWLDERCLSGEVVWARLSVPDRDSSGAPNDHRQPVRRSSRTPSRATPITFLIRADQPWLLQAVRGDVVPPEPGVGCGAEVLEVLRSCGALFQAEVGDRTGRLPDEVAEGLWDGVTRGLVTADGFAPVRALFEQRSESSGERRQRRRGLRRGAERRSVAVGRWSLVPHSETVDDRDELAEAIAEQLLARWGVVFRDLLAREHLAVPWREVQWAFRRLEARGVIRGGRFVKGFSGEQFARPDAVELLRTIRKTPHDGEQVEICAADPLNLVGIVLPGERIPATRNQTITYTDGIT